MYYIISNEDERLKIVSNYEKRGHKMTMLCNYLSKRHINYVKNAGEIKCDGVYCFPDGLNCFIVQRASLSPDGYIFNGGTYLNFLFNLEIVYYNESDDPKKEICKLVKL